MVDQRLTPLILAWASLFPDLEFTLDFLRSYKGFHPRILGVGLTGHSLGLLLLLGKRLIVPLLAHHLHLFRIRRDFPTINGVRVVDYLPQPEISLIFYSPFHYRSTPDGHCPAG